MKMDYFTIRREKLSADLRTDGLDALLVTQPLHVSYLTGFSGDSSYVLISATGRTMLVSDDRFAVQIGEECPHLEAVIRPYNRTTSQAACEAIEKLGICKVGVESGHLTVAAFDGLKELAPALDWVPTRQKVEVLRIIKDPSEIEEIRGGPGGGADVHYVPGHALGQRYRGRPG